MHCIISSFQCINELEWPKQAFHTNVYHQWWLVCTCPRWFWSKCSDWQTFRQYLMHLMYHLMKYQTDFCSSWWTFWWSCMNNQSLISWWWCFRGVPWCFPWILATLINCPTTSMIFHSCSQRFSGHWIPLNNDYWAFSQVQLGTFSWLTEQRKTIQ